MTRSLSATTYSDVVIQVKANREVDPLITRNHRGSVSRVLDDVQLVLRTNTAYNSLSEIQHRVDEEIVAGTHFGRGALPIRKRQQRR